MRSHPETVGAPALAAVKLAVLVGVAVALFGATLFIDVSASFSSMRDWISEQGRWMPVAFVILYAAAVVAAAPGLLLTASAGALFGSVTGIIVVSLGATLGAAGAFIIARFVARDTVRQWLAKREMLSRLDALIEQHGALVVAVVRLIPLFPFNLVNYAFGLTRIRFRTYLFWSWLCMLPEMALYVLAADAVVVAVRHGTVPWVLLGIALAIALALAIAANRVRRRLAAERARELEAALEHGADSALPEGAMSLDDREGGAEEAGSKITPP